MVPATQFRNLPVDRQDQIMDACLSEFAAYGYDLASTNRIVRQAGISKGVLFKYFKDKEALFTYLCDVAMRGYFMAIPREPADDLFQFIRRTTVYKLEFLRENPLTYQLLVRVLKEPRHPVYAKVLASQSSLVEEFIKELQTVLRQDELRPGLSWRHVMNFVSWVGFGLQEKYMSTIPDVVNEDLDRSFQPMIDELNVYLDILKFGIYKEAQEP